MTESSENPRRSSRVKMQLQSYTFVHDIGDDEPSADTKDDTTDTELGGKEDGDEDDSIDKSEDEFCAGPEDETTASENETTVQATQQEINIFAPLVASLIAIPAHVDFSSDFANMLTSIIQQLRDDALDRTHADFRALSRDQRLDAFPI
jgi:hypothetical protein